jgi:hypothetical protein
MPFLAYGLVGYSLKIDFLLLLVVPLPLVLEDAVLVEMYFTIDSWFLTCFGFLESEALEVRVPGSLLWEGHLDCCF